MIKDELKVLLNREVTVSKLTDGKFIVDYVNYNAPALSLVGETEDEAIQKLFDYLKNKVLDPAIERVTA